MPAGDADTPKPQVAHTSVVETQPAAHPSAPDIVLVPVAPEPQAEPGTAVPAQPTREALLAAYERAEHDEDDDDHHGDREHRGREDDHDDDD